MERVYLDNAATTKIRPEVLDVMVHAYSEFGNPSSVHREGQHAKKAIEEARESIALSLNCDPAEIYFTSGGTESDNWAVKCAAKGHVITSKIEHPAVLRSVEMLEKHGLKVTYLPVDKNGLISPDSLEKALTPDTSLVSVMMANNEIGTIEPIRELSSIAHDHGTLFHTDAVQAIGTVPVDIQKLGVDLLSFSAHKFYGPKGIGGLYVKKGTEISALLNGGSQEFNMRAGTQNVPGILGMAEALRLSVSEQEKSVARISELRDLLKKELVDKIPAVLFHGDESSSLPGIVNFYVPGMDGEKTLLLLDVKGFACSGGAACSSKDSAVSHVLSAIGATKEEAKNSLRISIGAYNEKEEIHSFVDALSSVLRP